MPGWLGNRLFAVIRTKGRAWDPSRPMRSQAKWSEHAEFMDKLAADGFVVLGGPLGDSGDFLIVMCAIDEDEVQSVVRRDPWTASGMLDLKSLQPWTILLESL